MLYRPTLNYPIYLLPNEVYLEFDQDKFLPNIFIFKFHRKFTSTIYEIHFINITLV